MNNKKLFTKALSISLTAAMVLTMAPMAAEMSAPKSMKAPKESMIKVGQKKTITATRKSKKSTTDVKYVKFSPAKTKNIGISVKTSASIQERQHLQSSQEQRALRGRS